MRSTSVVIRWFGSPNCPNQKAAICVNTRPLSGTPLGNTQSKALKRSVLTSRSRSPRS